MRNGDTTQDATQVGPFSAFKVACVFVACNKGPGTSRAARSAALLRYNLLLEEDFVSAHAVFPGAKLEQIAAADSTAWRLGMADEIAPQSDAPSDRDIRVYVLHKIEGFTLRRIGAQMELHYTRVHQIVKEVEPWVLGQLMADHPDRMSQKMLATQRLEHIYRQALKGWRKSLKQRERKTTKTGGKYGTSTEDMTEQRSGDPAMLARALEAQRQISELWGLADPKRHQHEGHLTGTLTHVGDEPLSLDEQADQVIADLYAEAERRGIIIDVEHALAPQDSDGPGEAAAGNGKPESLPPPGDDRREGPNGSA